MLAKAHDQAAHEAEEHRKSMNGGSSEEDALGLDEDTKREFVDDIVMGVHEKMKINKPAPRETQPSGEIEIKGPGKTGLRIENVSGATMIGCLVVIAASVVAWLLLR